MASADEETGRGPDGRFLKGHSGNPGGRPKTNMMSLLQDELDSMPLGDITRGEMIVKMLVALAERGNLQAIDFILKRFAPEKLAVELSGPDKGAIPVEWVGDADRKLDELLERHPPDELLEKLQ